MRGSPDRVSNLPNGTFEAPDGWKPAPNRTGAIQECRTVAPNHRTGWPNAIAAASVRFGALGIARDTPPAPVAQADRPMSPAGRSSRRPSAARYRRSPRDSLNPRRPIPTADRHNRKRPLRPRPLTPPTRVTSPQAQRPAMLNHRTTSSGSRLFPSPTDFPASLPTPAAKRNPETPPFKSVPLPLASGPPLPAAEDGSRQRGTCGPRRGKGTNLKGSGHGLAICSSGCQ